MDNVSKSEFNQAMSEQAKSRSVWLAEREALESALNSLKNPKPTIDNRSYLFDELRTLRNEVKNGRLDAAKREAVKRFPIVATVPDLLVGDTEDEVMVTAAHISQSLGYFEYSGHIKEIIDFAHNRDATR